ncbi:MAG TPA: aromatic amino acid hydroxylase [Anaeromyxobacter sp.]|nr:aromatic amino acid hydroxylase [Anaeromyxobacter sp.]
MTPTEFAIAALPPHLQRYAVPQDYAAYTPRDQAVWRHILRRLTRYLEGRAHPLYRAGLAATGIEVERIPDLNDMNRRLRRIGWSAIGVRGFIPPAVFTELQSRRVLAIAADIRSHEHVEYTPAPDIVHESAGHAPFLADPTYARYLQAVGEAGFRAIPSAEDQAVFEAIRNLSVVKEDPAAGEEERAFASERLDAAIRSVRYLSESIRASRLFWWTAEYGLVGSSDEPRLYGAGLLSSLGEAAHCLTQRVTKVPLSPACVEVAFDITRMQPQLFVARDFDHLFEVLDEFVSTLSWRRGGDHGLAEAERAGTVNHLVLSGAREISGRVMERVRGEGERAPGLCTALCRLAGPIQLSRAGHAEGRPWPGEALVAFGEGELPQRGSFALGLGGGLRLSGFAVGGGEVVDLMAEVGGRRVPIPSWALLLVSRDLSRVAAGAADAGGWDSYFGELTSFAGGDGEARARAHKATALPPRLEALYAEVRRLREGGTATRERLLAIRDLSSSYADDWLLRQELDELVEASEQAAAGPPAAD